MRISSAVYLINHAVSAALESQQNAKDNGKQPTMKVQRGKEVQSIAGTQRGAMHSSAYRVTISSAAMQKIAALGNA